MVMVTGKPMTNTDSCGATRLSRPSAMFSVSSRQINRQRQHHAVDENMLNRPGRGDKAICR
jgi:hypothetical protein